MIEGIDLKGTASLNTLVEANAMIQHARKKRYTDIYVTASPFHQLRAFMTAVTAALRFDPKIRIYSCNGHPLPWLERVVHSQGETAGPRTHLLRGEFHRIRKYQLKGDLADDADVVHYLDHRDHPA